MSTKDTPLTIGLMRFLQYFTGPLIILSMPLQIKHLFKMGSREMLRTSRLKPRHFGPLKSNHLYQSHLDQSHLDLNILLSQPLNIFCISNSNIVYTSTSEVEVWWYMLVSSYPPTGSSVHPWTKPCLVRLSVRFTIRWKSIPTVFILYVVRSSFCPSVDKIMPALVFSTLLARCISYL